MLVAVLVGVVIVIMSWLMIMISSAAMVILRMVGGQGRTSTIGCL
jgi:hypothetical protein